MNKKKILALAISMAMVVPTVAFAKEGGNKNNDINMGSIERQLNNIQNKDKKEADKQANEAAKKAKEEEKQAKEQSREDKKKQKEEFKTQMKAKREQLTSLRKETEGLRSEISQKKDQLSAILKDVQAGNKTLSQDMLNSLMEIAKTLKADGEQVRATGKINNEVSDVQGKIKGEDFNNALSSMDKVIAKMQARLDALKKLNSDLDAALKVANLATTPSTTDNSNQTTNTGSQTPTTDSVDNGSQTSTTNGTDTTATTTDNTTQAPTTGGTETTTN